MVSRDLGFGARAAARAPLGQLGQPSRSFSCVTWWRPMISLASKFTMRGALAMIVLLVTADGMLGGAKLRRNPTWCRIIRTEIMWQAGVGAQPMSLTDGDT